MSLPRSPSNYEPGFGVYVHWPFCLSKCPYCDFNSHVRAAGVDQARYVAAFARELAHRAALAPGREVTSIFFGGGTPSLMKPETVGAILDQIARNWSISPKAEITLEANPTSVEAERFRGYRSAGVNRVSLGVQAMNDVDLKMLGRLHSAEEAIAAVKIATDTFERASFDLIYARPDQTPQQWREELRLALAHAPEHLSLYQLTIEPDTMFEKLVEAGKLVPPDEEVGRALWDVTQEVMEQVAMPAYEVSNHARAGGESRHNLCYWRYGEYAGVGPGAHGRLLHDGKRLAQSTIKHPESWLEQVEQKGHGLSEEEVLTPQAQGDEFLLMGLRLREGIDPQRYEALTGRTFEGARLQMLLDEGLIAQDVTGRLSLTAKGFPLLDSVVAELA
jgi:putative oxygen-independent coproporphyrinogen III oxidase